MTDASWRIGVAREQAFSTVLTLEEKSAVAIRFIPRAAANPGFQFHRIPELDGFRGVAITLVIAGQLLEYHSASAQARALALSMAQVGVLLFFVLSGFLITGVLYRERSVTGSVDFKQFYLRLAPALPVFLCSVIVLMRLGLITDVPRKELLERLL